jgi:hypothetical protein
MSNMKIKDYKLIHHMLSITLEIPRADFIAPIYKYPSLDISGKARYGVRLKNKKMFLKNSTLYNL